MQTSARPHRQYAGAQVGRLTADWTAINTSGDAELVTSLRLLRARSRQVCRDNEHAKNALRLVANNVIGSGVGMQATVRDLLAGPSTLAAAALRAPLLKVFPAALLGRVVTIPYYPLSDAMIEAIASHKLRSLARRLGEGYGAELVIGEGAMQVIKDRCTEIESGGRMIDAILTNTLMPELSRRILGYRLEGKELRKVVVTGGEAGFGYEFG